ncbi:MAG: hypothetical protein K8R59_03540 [Thermoanaerobaculales bacterium]|nr:hypothetical protein [Thermoanaerobaculales bacterium]
MKSYGVAYTSAIIILAAFSVGAGDDRTLTTQFDAASLAMVQLESGVGDVEVFSGGGDLVRAEVILSPRRGGFFSSLKTSRRQIQEATLEAEVRGDVLRLNIDSGGKEQRFEERWTLFLPSHLIFNLDLGVGDVKITDLMGGVNLEIGVGEVEIAVSGGSVQAEIGVGGVTIHAPIENFGGIECAAGVGDVLIKAEGHKITGEGFIGHAAEWKGEGENFINAEVGVGNVHVVLE